MSGGLRADRLVSGQLLECLSPLGLGAGLDAIASLPGTGDERTRQKELAQAR